LQNPFGISRAKKGGWHHRAAPVGGVACPFGALSMVAECGVERVGLGRGADVRHLPGFDADADHRRPVLPGDVGRGLYWRSEGGHSRVL